MRRPTIVTLVGSSKFQVQHEYAQKHETLLGKIVIPMGMYGHHEGLDVDGPVKQMLDRLHLEKIKLADEILVVNPGGYVGTSSAREMIFAATREVVDGQVIRSGSARIYVWEPNFVLAPTVPMDLADRFRRVFQGVGVSFRRPSWLKT